MKKALFCLPLLLFSLKVLAQDVYHTSLISQLQTEYSLPATGVWVLPNTETATFNASSTYGATTTNLNITGQPFSQARRFVVAQGADPWSSGHLYKNQTTINAGDNCLFVVWMRSPTVGAQVNLFAENSTTYLKEFYPTVKLSGDWMQFFVPFKSTATFTADQLNLGVHLASLTQTIEVGGVAVLNFKNTVTLAQLPTFLNNTYYTGIEPNAPWRAEAAASIEQIRKANLSVLVKDSNGQPFPNATVKIEMLQHEFGFGSAVVSNKFNGGSQQNSIYEQKLYNLDGNGHGFNEVVFENDLKWDAWEGHWLSSHAEIASDLAWLTQKGIRTRGHNLVWPKWEAMPDDMESNKTDPVYLRNRIRNHLQDILGYPGVGGKACVDWDVINETTELTELADALKGTPGYPTGREIYSEIYRMTDSLIPDAKLYANDYVAIERGEWGNASLALWRSRLDELVAAGAPLEGIGFQGHFSTQPTGIPRVKEIYDEFYNAYGLEAKVTEYDIDKNVPPATQASYMRDILTVTFAHPSMKAFLMWGFWDGAHWQGNAPIFAVDWSLKPSGTAFIDQVFHRWWTDYTLVSGPNGLSGLRGFKGKYKITVTCNGASQSQLITLDGDKNIEFDLACTVSATQPESPEMSLHLVSTVVQDELVVSWKDAQPQAPITFCVLDMAGKRMLTQVENQVQEHGTAYLNLGQLPQGVYVLRAENGRKQMLEKFVVVR